MKLYRLADLGLVWVQAQIYEQDLPYIKLGQDATVTLSYMSDREFRGRVTYIYPNVDEKTRTVGARVVVANPGGELRPGMFVTVRFLLPGGKKVLAVPKVAVLSDEGRPFVFVHREGEYWIRRSVTLGRRLGDRVEVQGLPAGQRIIADGSFLLKSDVLRKKMGAGCAD